MTHLPRLYDDLADWYTLLTAPEDYAEEAGWYVARLRDHARRELHTVLELGAGAGANAFHMKRHFRMTLVDLSAAMLRQSQRINPELEHVVGDMRSVRLDRRFDAVFVHDAASYLTSADDVRQAVANAAAHLEPGGVVMFCPDDLRETWTEDLETGGHDGPDGRAVRYLEWSWAPAGPGANPDLVFSDYAYLLRDADGSVRVEHDRHMTGRLPRQVWLDALTAAGLEARSLPLEHSEVEEGRVEVFVGTSSPDRPSQRPAR